MAAIGQSLRQRDGRLSADSEISRNSTGGVTLLAEGVEGARTRNFSPAGVTAVENTVGPQRRPLTPSVRAVLGVVAQGSSGCSATGVRSIDLERRRGMIVFLSLLGRICERDVMW